MKDNKEFDRHFKSTQRTIWLVFVINAIIALSVLGGIGYVVIHFLGKVW